MAFFFFLPEIESKIRWAFKKTNGSWVFETPCRVHVQKIVHVEKRLSIKVKHFFSVNPAQISTVALLWRNASTIIHFSNFIVGKIWPKLLNVVVISHSKRISCFICFCCYSFLYYFHIFIKIILVMLNCFPYYLENSNNATCL